MNLPINIPITPRLLAAAEAALGQKLPRGAIITVTPKPEEANPLELAKRRMTPKHPGQTCHLCGSDGYACEHIPGVPF